MNEYPHYFKALPPGCTHIDVYRVLALFEVSDPALQHAVKKLLCAGARGAKDQGQDIAEAIATLQRWQQMRAEEQDWRRDAKERQLNTSQEIQDRLDRIPVYAPACCHCGAREASACPGQWEPGCDLGAKEAHAVPAPPEAAEALRVALMQNPLRFIVCEFCGNKRCPHAQDKGMRCTRSNEPGQVGVPIEQPAPAAAPEDAERAAYLERWRNAPADATHLAQDSDGKCYFYESEPILDSDQNWFGACALRDVADNLLGSVRCEPRPRQGEGQGVEG